MSKADRAAVGVINKDWNGLLVDSGSIILIADKDTDLIIQI